MSRSSGAHVEALSVAEQRIPEAAHHSVAEHVKFEDLGLHTPITSALNSAFPNITRPTEAQAKFIPAILSGKDVLLKDGTGSGK